MRTGIVTHWDRYDESGTITGSDGVEYYFDKTSIPGYEGIRVYEGDKVRFDKYIKITLTDCAHNVTIVGRV